MEFLIGSIGFIIGFVLVYLLTKMSPNIPIRPSLNNLDNIYKDDNGVKYKYSVKFFDCPSSNYKK